jgi:3-phenylpropionate/cinnamic acid dioxygenase small subunit
MSVDELRQIKDRLDIHDLLHRYAAMVDRRSWEQLPRVFSEDAQVDYTSTGGKKGPYREVMTWLDRALEPWPINLHFISNIELEIAGDRATGRCYFNAPMGRPSADGGQEIITNGGWYEDEFVRTSEGWRISRRLCQQTVMIGELPHGYAIPE